jgi:hypothetical protein
MEEGIGYVAFLITAVLSIAFWGVFRFRFGSDEGHYMGRPGLDSEEHPDCPSPPLLLSFLLVSFSFQDSGNVV